METKTPLQKAFADYINNKYYFAQLVALAGLIYGIITIDEFHETFGAVIIFSICGAVILVPFIFMFSWANQYKKGTRK